MADAPPPYSAQPAYNPAFSPQSPGYNPGYPAQPGYPPAQPGYPPAQPGYPPAQPGYPGYPPAQPGYPDAGKGYPQQGPPVGYQPGPAPQAVYPPPAARPQQQQQQTTVVITSVPQGVPPGVCGHCRVGHATDDFTCCGICLAILFFPLGLICCLLMRQTRCSNCGAYM